MENLFDSILPAHLLGIRVERWSNGRIELAAPLANNLNDKGTAFAGSIDALLDLAGWSAITLALRDAGIEAEVMIVKSETEYSAAVQADMTAAAGISGDDINRISEELDRRGRSRAELSVRLRSDDQECARMTAQYMVIKKTCATGGDA